jgi:outer membrane protein TolC
LDDGTPRQFDFQYCYSGPNAEDRNFNINTVGGWFSQLSDAGVRFEFRAETMIPITTFGKIRNAKRAARAGLALKQLQRLQAEQETILRVMQAHNTLLLARRTIGILREAKKIVDKATDRVEKDVGSGDDWDAEPTGDAERDPDDLFKVKLASTEVDQLMRKALKIESLSLSALWALAGHAAPRGFDISETDLTPYTIRGGLQDLDSYKELAVRNRPEARMASAAVKAREYQEKLARSNFLPDLGIILQYSTAVSTSADQNINQIYYTNGFNYSRLVAAIGMRWRWDFHLKAFDLRSARATLRAAEYQKDAARLLLGRDVEQAYADLVEAKHIVQKAREAVDWSWKLVVSGEQRDTIGGGNTTELLRALEKWYRKRFELEEAIQAHNDALARLSRAVGTALAVPTDPAKAASAAP